MRLLLAILLAGVAFAFLPNTIDETRAARVSDVRNTRHNLSVTGPGTVKATSETQVCVFCHTPHGAENQPGAPLWNRQLSSATYTPYSSASIDANAAQMAAAPGGTSKLCLSCHDGTLAIANVDVLNGAANVTIPMSGTGPGNTMPAGAGTQSGFTRNLGTNLTNDHPISFTYDAALAAADGELRVPDGTRVGLRQPGLKPTLPLDNGQMQCSTCHDPHLRETDVARGNIKFLRVNRFQAQPPSGGLFSETADIICVACHDKGGQLWSKSAHANPNVASQVYKDAAADQREFPRGLRVWEAACLNCHDTHTVQGARRLAREGTDSTTTPKSGGGSAIEETCYQCHRDFNGGVLVDTSTVPNIRDEFTLSAVRMPITIDAQGGVGGVTSERHDIGTGTGTQLGKDFVESPDKLGKGNLKNRHVECTDCHNPHRVTKRQVFNEDATTPTSGTHPHSAGRTNIASGVLRGTTGVEPVYGGAAFGTNPITYDVKRGDGGVGASTAAGAAWVTREYQVCLKCHSNYAYDTPPALGHIGGTPSGTNSVVNYTNQAMEFQAPPLHRGETTASDSGAFAGQVKVPSNCTCGQANCSCYNVDFQAANHRGWHPVIDSTGRSYGVRAITSTSGVFRSPFNAAGDVGAQTMYCSECHGASTPDGSIVPSGKPWGPHGSSNPFLLKGSWDASTGSNSRDGSYTVNALCFKCHEASNYASRNGNGSVSNRSSGFYNSSRGNLHAYHTDKIERLRCTWCHVAVPHGWKNKALLVNLNDVGPEGGLPAGTQVRNHTTAGYTNPPYYLNAMLKVRTFATSGSWGESNCGSAGAPGNGQSGKSWMRDSDEACVNSP